MVSPMAIASGIGAAGSILGGLFGKKKGKVQAPTVEFIPLDRALPGVNPVPLLQGQSDSAGQQRSLSNQLLTQIPESLKLLDAAPTIDSAAQQELDFANSIFARNLDLAKLTGINELSNSFGGVNNQLGTQGAARDGAFAQLLKGGLASGVQSNINNLAVDQGNKLIALRQSLLDKIQQRMLTKVQGLLGAQAQFDSQAGANTAQVYNAAANERNARMNVNSMNANLKFAADAANSANANAMSSTLFSIGGNLLGSLMGKGGN
jgi:hypothetical protein